MTEQLIQVANLMSPVDRPWLTGTALVSTWVGLVGCALPASLSRRPLSCQVARQLDRKMLRGQCEPVRHSVDAQLLFPRIHLLVLFLFLVAQKDCLCTKL